MGDTTWNMITGTRVLPLSTPTSRAFIFHGLDSRPSIPNCTFMVGIDASWVSDLYEKTKRFHPERETMKKEQKVIKLKTHTHTQDNFSKPSFVSSYFLKPSKKHDKIFDLHGLTVFQAKETIAKAIRNNLNKRS